MPSRCSTPNVKCLLRPSAGVATVLSVLALALLLTSGCNRNKSPSPSIGDIVELIDKLEPWTADGRYSPAGWRRIIATAKVLQACDTNTVALGLSRFFNEKRSHNYQGSYEEDSKPFLLLRIIFDLPERAPTNRLFAFNSWDRTQRLPQGLYSGFNEDGTVNLAWPIVWKSGDACLADAYIGSSGPLYNAAAEYMYMYSQFALRKLESRQ